MQLPSFADITESNRIVAESPIIEISAIKIGYLYKMLLISSDILYVNEAN